MGQLDGIFETAAGITSAMGLLAFVAAAVLVWQLYRTRQQKKQLELLPETERAKQIDDFLTRYKITGEKLSQSKKFQLIQEELRRRFLLKVVFLIVLTIAGVVCFGIAVFASARSPSPSPSPTAVETDPSPEELALKAKQKKIAEQMLADKKRKDEQEKARLKLAEVQTTLSTLDGLAEPMLEATRAALEFTAEMDLKDGPWKVRDTIARVLVAFKNMIPPDDFVRLQQQKQDLDEAYSKLRFAAEVSPEEYSKGVKLVKDTFIKKRDEEKQRIEKSVIEDWTAIQSTVTAYCELVGEFLDGKATIDVVNESYKKAAAAFATRLSNINDPPKLLILIGELNAECLTLKSP